MLKMQAVVYCEVVESGLKTAMATPAYHLWPYVKNDFLTKG